MNQQIGTSDARLAEGLDFLWIELTNQCNLQCSHCYSESGPHEPKHGALAYRDYERIITEAYDTGCRKVQFIGGEPTLNQDLSALIAYASGMGYEFIEVFTNLNRLPDDLLSCFKLHGVHVATSVYGPDATVHDGITGVSGSFDRTIRNIRMILSEGLTVRAGFIEMEQNAGLYNKTREFLNRIGVESVGTDHMRRFGRGSGCEKAELGELCGECGKDTLCVAPDGQVSPCIMSKAWPVGSVTASSIADIVSSGILAGVRSDIRDATTGKQAICDPKTCNPYDHCQPKWGGGPCEPTGCTPCYPKGISAKRI